MTPLPADPPADEPPRVLVVDDASVPRVALARRAAALGLRVEQAADGRRALEALRSGPFDLVFLDLEMPEMDGQAVLERMKADPALREIPVVVVSAVDDLARTARAIASGAEDFLPKPFDPVLLNARVGACLEKKRLRDAERRKTEALEQALRELRAAQERMLVQEKMASLGALTAGIAHEIKNPLNFIVNFARLSADLIPELREALAHSGGKLSEEATDLLTTLEENVAKVCEHGRRADEVVAAMLLHARGGKAEPREADLNALVARAVELAYHGLRAREPAFHARIDADYDAAVGRVRVVPQDLSRVFLNLAGNACYAAWQKAKSCCGDFVPTLTVRTRDLGGRVEVRVRDNGDGVPAAVRDKLFQPFFTTKPPGAGTGLGLSISREIVVRVHGGELRLESREGEYAEFIVVLPRGEPGAPALASRGASAPGGE